MTSLAAATLFVIPPDGGEGIRLAHAWTTAISGAASGKEVRAAIRSVPVRRLEFTPKFVSATEVARFRALWLGATERLRYTVPVWPMASPPTAYSSSTDITTDTVGRGFVIGQTALLWTSETNFEVVTVDALSDTHITTHVPVVGTFPVGLAIVVPLMNAWLDPPTIDQRMQRAEAVPLVFREELPAVAGIDPSVGAAVTPTPASISVVQIKSGSPWAGRQFDDREVYIFDAAGQRILDPPLVWTVTQTGSIALPHPPVSLTFPQRGQQVHFDNGAVPGAAFSVRVDCGSLSATFGL